MSTLVVNSLENTSGLEHFTAKAWVNFNGTGAVAIRNSGNVSSITDGGTGTYTVNFTTAMADTNYAPVATCKKGTANHVNTVTISDLTAPTTGGCTFRCLSSTATATYIGDSDTVTVTIFA